MDIFFSPQRGMTPGHTELLLGMSFMLAIMLNGHTNWVITNICLMRHMKRGVNERKRSMDFFIEQYQQTVRSMFLQFIEPSKKYADIIFSRGGENRIAIDILKAKSVSVSNKLRVIFET